MRSIRARFQHLGLQRRIMLYVTAGLLALSALFAFVALQAIQQSSDLIFHERLLVAQTVARVADDDLVHLQRELEGTSTSVSAPLAAHDLAGAESQVHALYEHWAFAYQFTRPCAIFLTDAQNRVLWSEPAAGDQIGLPLDQDAALQTALRSQQPTFASEAGSSLVSLAVPVRSQNQTLGFLVSHLDLQHVGQILEPSLDTSEPGYNVELLDNTGRVLAHVGPLKTSSPSIHWPLVEPFWRAHQAGVRLHNLQVNGDDHSHVIAYAPLTQLPWGVVVEQPVDQALLLPRSLETRFTAFGLGALLGGLALAWLTTRRVVGPVNALIHASQEIASGHLDHPLDISGADEVGVLARSFDEMRVELKESREEIARWNRDLEARVEQRTRELGALVLASHALTATFDLDTVFEILMKETRNVLPAAEGITLFLLDPATRTIAVRACSGFEMASPCANVGIAGRVFESHQPSLVRTAAEGDTVGSRVVHSALGVPLGVKGTPLGALVVYSFTQENAFSESDTPILQALANQAATAIENARLYAALAEKEQMRAQLLEQVIEAQEEERKRIARELHDDFAQTLTALTINLQSTMQNLPDGLNGTRQHLAETQALTSQTLQEINHWILELRPTVLDDLGLVPAIRWYAESRLEPEHAQVEVETVGLKNRLPTGIETALFRIVQEAVSNIAKHARARRVTIRLSTDGAHITLTVRDDGTGFQTREGFVLKDGMRGIGLLGMRERTALLGGSLRIDSEIGGGTRVEVEIPWNS